MKEQKMVDLIKQIDLISPEYQALWERICNIETRSDNVEGLNHQCDVLEQYAREHGLSVQRIRYSDAEDPSRMSAGDALILTLPGETDTAPVAVLAHMDTVHEKGIFGYPPVTRQGDRLYGPGVIDCKGGICVGLMAMEGIRRSGLPHRTVRMILNSDEESGEYMGEKRRFSLLVDGSRGCAAAFNCETGVQGKMTVGRKGVLRIGVDITGLKAHAGNAYFKGASAVREAAYKIIELEKQSRENGMTFNVGLIQGGTVVNIVPDACHMEVDIRIMKSSQMEEAKAVVDRIVSHSYVEGTRSSWTMLHFLPAMEETEANHRLFDQIAEAAKEYELEDLQMMFRGGGSDSAFTVTAGIPTVCSMGTTGSGEHTERETADTASLERRAKILAVSIMSLKTENLKAPE